MVILRDISLLWVMAHALILFLGLSELRYSIRKTVTISLVTILPLTVINLVLLFFLGFDGYGTLMLLTLSVPSMIISWFLVKNRDGRFFFTFCMVDTVMLELIYITNILNHYLTPDSFLLMFLARLIVCPVMVFLAWTKLRPIYLQLQQETRDGWWTFAAIGLLFYGAITLIMTYPENIVNRPHQLPALTILFILMPVVYMDIVATLNQQRLHFRQIEQDHLIRLQMQNIIARMDELGEANEAFRRERHDFRHKLKAIASLVRMQQYEELAHIVADYEDSIARTHVVRYAKSSILDAVLSVYIQKAQKADISLKLGFDFPEEFAANESELAMALANAIENAIHACEKLPREERSLEIKVLSKPRFIIMIRNSFDGNVTFDASGIPENHQEGHGLGSRSIAAFCTRAGGYYEFSASGKVFTLFMHLK